MGYLNRVDALLGEIEAGHRYRQISRTESLCAAVDFTSNDYLGLASEPQTIAALREATCVGSGGARLLGGHHREHASLEEELAHWLGRERALLFSSGYHAALGAIPVLAEVTGAVLSDERNHASLIDGVRLSRAPRAVYAHGNLPSRANSPGGALVVTESIFSMDGDAVDVPAMLALLGSDDVLLIDEAHALGVAGPEGAGLARTSEDPRVVVLGTLSKALGAHGGFIAGPAKVIDLLVNRARTFIFDTALPPAIASAARCAVRLARDGDELRARLRANAASLRAGLRALGHLELGVAETSPIVPLVLGEEERALRVSAQLRDRGILAPAIRPPTVAAGSSRLRFSVRSNHAAQDIERTLEELRGCIAIS